MHTYRLLILAGLIALAGCASIEPLVPPEPLVEYTPAFNVEEIWSAGAASDSEDLNLGLRPVSDGARVYAASYDGEVTAYELETGDEVWSVTLEQPGEVGWFSGEHEVELSAGPTVADGLLAVGGSDGTVALLEAASGRVLWQHTVSSAVLAPPAIGGGYVVVHTVDGALTALAAGDGSERWVTEQPVPALTLRGSAAPVINGDTVYAGFDNGKLLALDLADGRVRWEVPVATPSGRTDLERLVDLDGVFKVTSQVTYAAAYHGNAMAITNLSGQVLWAQEVSSLRGLDTDWQRVYVTDEASELWALDGRSGAVLWRQDDLRGRNLTAPARFQNFLVVGDYEGYVHFLSTDTGVQLTRIEIDGSRIIAPPLAVNDILVVQTEEGTLVALKIAE